MGNGLVVEDYESLIEQEIISFFENLYSRNDEVGWGIRRPEFESNQRGTSKLAGKTF